MKSIKEITDEYHYPDAIGNMDKETRIRIAKQLQDAWV
jgi:hypothetical protein